MKRLTQSLLLVCLSGMLFACAQKKASMSKDNQTDIIALRVIKLLDGVKSKDFEKFAGGELVSTFNKLVPGVTAYVMKGNRGTGKGGYMFVQVFDSLERRNFYWPDDGKRSEEAIKLWKPVNEFFVQRLYKFVKPFGQGDIYTDFLVLD